MSVQLAKSRINYHLYGLHPKFAQTKFVRTKFARPLLPQPKFAQSQICPNPSLPRPRPKFAQSKNHQNCQTSMEISNFYGNFHEIFVIISFLLSNFKNKNKFNLMYLKLTSSTHGHLLT